jgi:hypothetical protein
VRLIAFLLRVGLVVTLLSGMFALLDGGAGETSGTAAAASVGRRSATKPVARKPPTGRFTFSAVGDVMMGSMPTLPAEGGSRYFSKVASVIRADVALANLEGTLSTGGSSKCSAGSTSCFAFHTPPSYARWLRKANFTVLNLANNHAADFGPTGEAQTLAALNGQRLRHTGRPGEIAVQTVHGIRVAVIGFAPYPWAQSLTDLPAAKRTAGTRSRSPTRSWTREPTSSSDRARMCCVASSGTTVA